MGIWEYGVSIYSYGRTIEQGIQPGKPVKQHKLLDTWDVMQDKPNQSEAAKPQDVTGVFSRQDLAIDSTLVSKKLRFN